MLSHAGEPPLSPPLSQKGVIYPWHLPLCMGRGREGSRGGGKGGGTGVGSTGEGAKTGVG